MYYLTVESHFSSAHQLRGYKGKCENLHGHNWRVIVTVKGETLDEIGLLIDFHDLKAYVKDVMAEIDHKNLNELEMFKEENPSSENLAHFIYSKLSKKLSAHPNVVMESATVFESDTSQCTYKEQ